MSLPAQLSQHTLSTIVSRLHLQEDGAPYKSFTSPMSPEPVGAMRIFRGETLAKLVTISLVVPPIGLDSHMIFAFTPSESAIPHFTLDSVQTGPTFAFHLDLIPRADLGANLAYMNHALHPLTPLFDSAKQIEGLTPAFLSPRQYALMSPWMLAYRATESAFAQIDAHVTQYLAHWLRLVEKGIPADALPAASPAELAVRDQRNRAGIFSPEVDPVWAMVTRLVGAEAVAEMRAMLLEQ
ncbi:MAG TPA: hypothetical protein PK299_13740 [Anaerolineales bacterium]|nr:hypothetical protein [Anaerolineales bacterium]